MIISLMEVVSANNELSLKFKQSPFDRERNLCIHPCYLQFENKDLRSDLYTCFQKSDIIGFRYGIKWIRGFEFVIGREYNCHFLSKDEQVMKIKLKSFYGINKTEHFSTYSQILNYSWHFYFEEMVVEIISRFRDGEDIELGRVRIMHDCLSINIPGVINNAVKIIDWPNVRTKGYQTYFAIYDIDHAASSCFTSKYLDDWNTGLLKVALRTILAAKEIEKYE